MNCRYHPIRTAVNTCSQCGDWLCEECTANVDGRVYCASCLKKYWIHDHDAHAAASPPVCCPPRLEHPRRVNAGLLLIFSALPGVNYMYEGLIKRGLFILSGFFLTCYLAGSLSGIFGLIIPIMLITCVFDAFRIRGKLIANEYVPDSVEDILGFVRRYKAAILLILVFILGFHFLGFVSRSIVSMPYMAHRILGARWVVPLLVLLGGIYFIILSGKHSSSSRDEGRDGPEEK